MQRLTGVLAALMVAGASQAVPIKRAMHPAISPDGKTLVFSWQGDLWSSSLPDERATRLTVHASPDMMPRWFPDGSRIAFVSSRYGNQDIFSIKPNGTDLQRVTFDSSSESLTGISADGKTLFGYTNGWGRINLFQVKASGGDIVPLTNHPLELQYFPSPSADGTKLAYNGGGSPGSWRNPVESGTDTGEIWIADYAPGKLTNYKQLTKNDNSDMFPMIAGGELRFFSNRSGKPNLWTMNLQGGSPKQLTNHDGGTLRWPTSSPNGDFTVYEYSSELWLYNAKTKSTAPLEIEVPQDAPVNPTLDLNLTSGVTEAAVSPDGKRAVIVVRGDLYLIPEKGGTHRRLTSDLEMDMNPVWLANNKILFASAKTGLRQLYTVDLDGKISSFATDEKDIALPALSPDGKWVAFHRGDREVVVMPVGGGAKRVLATASFPDAYRGTSSFGWSPDSKWITYVDDTERGTDVYVQQLEGATKYKIARVGRGATNPAFLANGKGVFFNSFEYQDGDIMVVDLVPQELTFAEDDLDKIDEEKPKPGPVEVKIDPRGIELRLRKLTNGESVALLSSPDGKAIWANVAGQLVALNVATGTTTPVPGVTGSVSSLSLVGAKVYGIAAGRFGALGPAGIAPAAFNISITIDRAAEELALFKEIWWLMDRLYYDPNHHGRGWQQLKERYAKIVPFCYDRADFYALMTEMIEELDSSHLGIQTPLSTTPGAGSDLVGWIGVDWDSALLASTGNYVVKKVLEGSSADHSQSLLLAGDRVIAVDGTNLGGVASYASLMKGKIGKKVKFTIERGGKRMDMMIKAGSPAQSSGLRYEDFLRTRRAEAERISGGKITYFHVAGMNTPSTDRFFRETRVYGEGKKGAVVDVRWNGGGNTAIRMLNGLRTQPWLYRKFRSAPNLAMTEEQFRGEAVELPSVLMTNQYSASNAEIFSEGYRRMKIGPIVGEATGGNVLTVSGFISLWDGGGIQIPFIGVVTPEGEYLEGKGRRVDIDVRFDPNAWNEGRDNQLEAAIRELMKRIK